MDVLARLTRSRPSAPLVALAIATLAAALLMLTASQANAKLEEIKVGSETLKFGVITREGSEFDGAPLSPHGGPVDSASYIYAIYWDPQEEYHSEWLRGIDGYLHDISAVSESLGNVFSLDGQYTAEKFTKRASYKFTYRGAYTDTFPYPTSERCTEPKGYSICLTDAQIRAELERFIANEHLPTGQEITYYLLTPPSVTVCLDGGKKGDCSTGAKELEEEQKDETGSPTSPEVATGICAYHSVIEPTSASPIVYGVQPWVAGHTGHVITQSPFKTRLPTGASLACQASENLTEPNQLSTFPSTESYEAGLSDLIINLMSMEQADIVSNPLMNGWYQEGTDAEQSDPCRGVYQVPVEGAPPTPPNTTHALNTPSESVNGDFYFMQWAFSSIGALKGRIECWANTGLNPHFTATTVVKGGDDVAFDALESSLTFGANPTEIELNPFTPATYKWEFGDGTSTGPSPQASIIHSYQYGGSYQVTLTVTDNAGNTTSFSQSVPVSGPPAPTPTPTPNPTPAPTPTSPSVTQTPATPTVTPAGSGTAPAGAGSPGTPPTIAPSVMSRSLPKAKSQGLAIHYQVNEQVAGQVEALLESSLAAKLGIKARPAYGLPGGYPRSVVVGSAVLVTTQGGQGTLHLKFTKTIARKLAKAKRLKLILRFVVRSASRPPRSTTVLSTAVLG